tara:strand:+ start:174 stop:344 length:171 start_codon:yes stop_codon:yes gene_type:complete
MSKCYVVAIDSMKTIPANSEAEAFENAKQEFVEMLQKGEAKLVTIEEFESNHGSEK